MQSWEECIGAHLEAVPDEDRELDWVEQVHFVIQAALPSRQFAQLLLHQQKSNSHFISLASH